MPAVKETLVWSLDWEDPLQKGTATHSSGLGLPWWPGGASGKGHTYQRWRRKKWGFNPWVGKIPWRRKGEPAPAFLPREAHGQRSLTDYSPQCCKELDTTEVVSHTHTHTHTHTPVFLGFPGGSDGKESTCSVGYLGSVPGLGRSPGKGNGNPLQYSYLENPMGRGAWWATVHGSQRVRHD